MIGKQLGSWILDRELGQGGMGTVYLAHHVESAQDNPKKAAVKVLAAQHTLEQSSLDRFQREIHVLRKLNHPHIVQLLDAGHQDGRHYYSMEYVDGPSFQWLLKDQGRLPWEQVLEMALQVCQALKHAHDHGIIHRDLKPSNLLRGSTREAEEMIGVLAGKYGRVKLTDFGIAWVFAEPHLTRPGAVVGTAEYISPEQAAGKQPNKKSDIYSLGVVMYALLTGRPPFEGEVVDLLHKHRYAQFDRPQKIATDVPYDLDAVICEMMEKEPDKRPPDAGVLFRRLDILRRKYERKAAQQTSADQSGRDTAVEQGEEAAAGPATLMAELMREELHRQNRGGPVKRFFNHPVILVVLFLTTLGLIIWSFWPVNAEKLYQKGAGLMASNNWREAEEIFDKLEDRFPNHPHKEAVAEFRKTIVAERAKLQARRMARLRPPMSEAQWFYERALRLRQQGKEKEAKAIFQDLITAFNPVPEEQAWVSRAKQELVNPTARARTGDERWAPLQKALEQIRKLEQEKKMDEAQAIRDAIAALYQSDPSAKDLLDQLGQKQQ